MKRWLKLVIFGFAILSVSLFANVLLHEAGHFAVADFYGLSPEIHLNQPVNLTGDSQFLNIEPAVAYVSYTGTSSDVVAKDAIIAMAGPAVNFILFGFSLLAYKLSKSEFGKIGAVIMAVPSFISGITNLIPIEYSDGMTILNFLNHV